jgi:hypothetical protein
MAAPAAGRADPTRAPSAGTWEVKVAISTNDRFYKAEFTPASIDAMAAPLRAAYGVGADAFGSKGNTDHDGGYHRSRRWVLLSPDSDNGASDYSVQLAADRGGNEDAVSAFDFTPGEWGSPDNRAKMMVLTKRLRAAARALDRRLADLREIAGTEDGENVVTFFAQGGVDKDPFNSSHLDHVHGSFWRSRNENNHQGIVEVMLGVKQEDEEEMSSPAVRIGPAETSIAVPGGLAWKPTWAAFCNDTGHGGAVAPKYALRIFTTKGDGNWAPIVPTAPGGLVIFESGRVRSFGLPENTRCMSVVRMAIDDTTGAAVPVGSEGSTAYAGDLSVAIERP